MSDPLYVFNADVDGLVAICEKCYDNGNSGYDIDVVEMDRRGDETLNIDRVCYFCGEYA